MFGFVKVEKADYPVTVLCRTLGVSTSGFYEWRHHRSHPSPRSAADTELVTKIKEIHEMSRRCYGSPTVHAELRLGGVSVAHANVSSTSCGSTALSASTGTAGPRCGTPTTPSRPLTW